MKKSIKKCVALVLVLLMAAMATACSSKETEKEATASEKTSAEKQENLEKDTEEAETAEEEEPAEDADSKEDADTEETAEPEEEAETEETAEVEETQEDTTDPTVLSADEEESIEILADDIVELTDDTYAETVSEIQNHLDQFSGQIYTMEGVYTTEHQGETPYIYRTLSDGEEETFCGLPLIYMLKDIEEGAWIRVTGIVNVHEVDEEQVNALEVVAIQTLEEPGEAVLEWSGSAHAH